jgi:hypothetical protein
MKNLSCYIMAVSLLVFACSDSSDETIGTGGSPSTDGTGGAQASTGGASDTPSPGGSAGTEPGGAAGASSGALGESGVPLSAIVVDLGESDVDKLCDWMASTLGLVAGPTPEDTWASGTWTIESCDETNEAVFMWASPQRCRVDLPSANAVGCLTLDVEGFEACLTETAEDLCRIDDVDVCRDFDTCFLQIVRE